MVTRLASNATLYTYDFCSFFIRQTFAKGLIPQAPKISPLVTAAHPADTKISNKQKKNSMQMVRPFT